MPKPKPKLRARDRGIPFAGMPGPRNAIVDVGKVAVGHTTVIAKPRVNTGVTAIWPRGPKNAQAVFAGYHALNGYGELTGAAWIEESGTFEGPLTLTNTYSLGTVRDAVLMYVHANRDALGIGDEGDDYCALPVVGETWDGELNDIFGFHVTIEHVHEALATATDAKSPEPIAGAMSAVEPA
jgi:L-aminopeptidase/D-esterase-like protein